MYKGLVTLKGYLSLESGLIIPIPNPYKLSRKIYVKKILTENKFMFTYNGSNSLHSAIKRIWSGYVFLDQKPRNKDGYTKSERFEYHDEVAYYLDTIYRKSIRVSEIHQS